MKDFIQYIIESTICIMFFYLIYRFFLRSATFYRFNRFFLLCGLFISFILPAINFSYDVHISPSPITILSETPVDEAPEMSLKPESMPYSYNIWHIITIIYIIGVAISLIRYTITVRKLKTLIKKGTKSESDKIEYISNENITTSFTLLKYIFLDDKNLSDTDKKIILNHEKIHIEQKHWIDLLCSECALLLLWFNPIMWLYVSAVKENHEFLVDKTMLDGGISRTLYQSVLINQQIQYPVFSFTNSIKMSNYLTRFTMMKKRKSSPWRKLAILAILPFIGTFVWLSAKPNYVYETKSNIETNITSNDSVSPILEFRARMTPSESVDYILDKALIIINGKESKINNVKLNDVESLSVLNSKSARDMYGEKSKNGVILITTKNAESKNTTNKETTDVATDISKQKTSEKAESKEDSEFWIRGISSFQTPGALVFIDGIEGNKNDIKIDEIESFSILRDASATAVFGEEGKNGVILITTKKGENIKEHEIVNRISLSKMRDKINKKIVEKNKEKDSSNK